MRAVGAAIAALLVVAGVGALGAAPAAAGSDGSDARGSAQATNDGENVDGTVESTTPGQPGGDPAYEPDAETQWPICWNDGLYYTTQEEQLNDIRREETAGRQGSWGWLICVYEDGRRTEELTFFEDEQPIDPAVLARSVRITPGVPEIQTSPPRDAQHMVGLETWYWVDPGSWGPVTGSQCAGIVCVEVMATPSVLVIDPGDGAVVVECSDGGVPYQDGLAPEAQQSDCTHTYEVAGNLTATATIVYDVTWSSQIGGSAGPGGSLGTLTPDAVPFVLAVAEAQALNTDG